MVSKKKFKEICQLLGEEPKLIYDGKNSSVFETKNKQVVKCVKDKYFFHREVGGYDLLLPYFKNHLPKRNCVNTELLTITYEMIDLPSFQQILLDKKDSNKKRILKSYRIFLNEVFQVVLSSRVEKIPHKNSKYFYNTNWHIDKLSKTNYLFVFGNESITAREFFARAISIEGQHYLSINSSLETAKQVYENARPCSSVVIHGDENNTNIFIDLLKPEKWFLIDPQWSVNGADWVVLVLELFNGWRKYLLSEVNNSVSVELSKKNEIVIRYDLSENNWPILREMDSLLFAKANECSKLLGDGTWFQRFKSFYLYKSIRGGIWGHLGNPIITAVSTGEGLRIFGSQNSSQVLEGL